MGQDQQAEVAQLYAHFCKGLANPNRFLIVCALAEHGMNVRAIATTTGLSQSNTSHNLKILRDQGIVCAERIGQSVFYTLADIRIVQTIDLLYAMMTDQLDHKSSLKFNKMS